MVVFTTYLWCNLLVNSKQKENSKRKKTENCENFVLKEQAGNIAFQYTLKVRGATMRVC